MLAASIGSESSILRPAWTDRGRDVVGSQRIRTFSRSRHSFLLHYRSEEDDNEFFALILDRRRASFGESALALAVVVISIFFLTQKANNIHLSFRRLQFGDAEHVYSSPGTPCCGIMLSIKSHLKSCSISFSTSSTITNLQQ